MKIITTYDKGSMTNRVEVIFYQQKTKDDVIPTSGITTFMTDEALEKFEAMTDEEAKQFIMSKSDIPEVRIIGSAPELDNNGKLKNKDEVFTPDV